MLAQPQYILSTFCFRRSGKFFLYGKKWPTCSSFGAMDQPDFEYHLNTEHFSLVAKSECPDQSSDQLNRPKIRPSWQVLKWNLNKILSSICTHRYCITGQKLKVIKENGVKIITRCIARANSSESSIPSWNKTQNWLRDHLRRHRVIRPKPDDRINKNQMTKWTAHLRWHRIIIW